MGDQIARDHGENIRYLPEAKQWIIWNGKKWEKDVLRRIDALARQSIERQALELEEKARTLDESQARQLRGVAIRARSRANLDHSLSLAATTSSTNVTRLSIAVADFDRPELTQHLLNCPNGMLNLRTRVLSPHAGAKDLLITKLCPTKYISGAQCPIFLETLRTIFEADSDRDRANGLILRLQMALGYSLSGAQDYHLVIILYGPEGRNGKSLIIDIVISVVGSGYTLIAPPGLLEKKRFEPHPTELAALHGKRFVAVLETSDHRLDEARVKRLSGGDPISARFMRGDFFEFPPTHHLWIATNVMPGWDPNDSALMSRVHVLPFRRRFLRPGDKGLEHENAVISDPGLKDRILESEREGVLAWLVEGYRQFVENGGLPPDDESVALLETHRLNCDPIAEWFDERCEDRRAQAPDSGSSCADIYNDYKSWKRSRTEDDVMSANKLGRLLVGKGFERRKVGGMWVRIGLYLRDADRGRKRGGRR